MTCRMTSGGVAGSERRKLPTPSRAVRNFRIPNAANCLNGGPITSRWSSRRGGRRSLGNRGSVQPTSRLKLVSSLAGELEFRL